MPSARKPLHLVAGRDAAAGAPAPCGTATAAAPSRCAMCDIRHLTIASVLPEGELNCLESITDGVELAPGQSLFQEGDKISAWYTIRRGTVRLYKLLGDGRRQITGFAMPGDILGLAARGGYAYGAEAIDTCELCRMPLADLRRTFERYPQLERRLVELAGEELATAQEQMLLLGRKAPLEKLASFLLSMTARARRAGEPDNPLYLPMSRGDIADYLGLTVETVSRSFTRLKGEGIIALPEPTRVLIVKRERLEALAEGG
jgi:CRP/FNR family transcriptional regulator